MLKQETLKNSARVLLVGICLVTQVATAQPGGGNGERRGPHPESSMSIAYCKSPELTALVYRDL